MSKFKLTQTAAEVQDILNNFNSLKSDAEGNLTVGKNLRGKGHHLASLTPLSVAAITSVIV